MESEWDKSKGMLMSSKKNKNVWLKGKGKQLQITNTSKRVL